MALGIVCEDPSSAPPSRTKRPYKQRASRRRDEVFTCIACSTVFVPKRLVRSRWCSAYCASRAKRAVQASPVSFPVCQECERVFCTRHRSTTMCSDACRRSAMRRHASEMARKEAPPKPPRVCLECTVVFAPQYGDKRKQFCSPACSRRSIKRGQRKAERARLRLVQVEVVNPTKVFDRDGWRCCQCRVKTPRKARGTYLDHAPELDHIIPLSVGGEHSYRNTQCLCRKCNGAKGATPLGQMRLFG
jgi:5-methylcytosine-specific restriction endonuclease McrA